MEPAQQSSQSLPIDPAKVGSDSVSASDVGGLPFADPSAGQTSQLPQPNHAQVGASQTTAVDPMAIINGTVPAVSVPTTQKNSVHSPDIADDVDLIEKEWVTKAKTIINSTRMDPHQQNQEMSKFKADYLKKRYSKDVKVSE